MLDFACNRLHKVCRTCIRVYVKGTDQMSPLDVLFRQVPEGMEFVGVLLTIIGSLAIMVLLGAWWSR